MKSNHNHVYSSCSEWRFDPRASHVIFKLNFTQIIVFNYKNGPLFEQYYFEDLVNIPYTPSSTKILQQ